MSAIDVVIIVIVSLIMVAIVFFSFVFPRLKGKKKGHCSSCPANKEKKIKRAFKDYHKENK